MGYDDEQQDPEQQQLLHNHASSMKNNNTGRHEMSKQSETPPNGNPDLSASSPDKETLSSQQKRIHFATLPDPNHTRSWSGTFSDLASDLLGVSPSNPIGKPPPAPRSRSDDSALQDYHEKSRKILVQAERQKTRLSSPPASYPSYSPGLNSSFRKRLESIEENDRIAAGNQESDGLQAKEHEPAVNDPIRNSRFHVRINSDEISALSMISTFSRESGYSQRQMDRLADFERLQQERFDKRKTDMERKLSSVMARDFSRESEKEEFIKAYMNELIKERETLIAEWKTELLREQEELHASMSWSPYKAFVEPCVLSIIATLSTLEVFIANLPLTIGAVGLSWVTMGTVWFKFMEENADFCRPVHFFSPECNFPEFPGCFECDKSQMVYQLALNFHFFCSIVAGMCCILFLFKVVLAGRAVVDELSNPTTSTPVGVICIAMVCVFAGRGPVGEAIVLITSAFHFTLAIWFLYMAICRFGLWPDPGWFPSTVGLSYAAVKTWLYFPVPGLILLGAALLFFFSIFFVSVVRVALNKKISAPVAWIGLSGPSIVMYAFTLVAQPSRAREVLLETDSELREQTFDWMVEYYLPIQHFMMILSLVGLASAVHALCTRWDKFRHKPFSPAHVAFCFPTLSHTNAVQAYRSGVDAFSSLPEGGTFKTALYAYWVIFLVCGTFLNILFTIMYMQRLPQWTKVESTGEEEPPAPADTLVQEILDKGAHEILRQPFVSPAVLQANEAGTLVRVKRGTAAYQIHGPYIRTRRISALGFDPTMDDDELRQERAELLDWVSKNAPRKRNRTMSNPLIWNTRGKDGRDIYGTFDPVLPRHKRSTTATGVFGI